MKKVLIILIIVVFILIIFIVSQKNGTSVAPKVDSIFGTYFTPRNFPDSVLRQRRKETNEYFELNAQIGNHTAIILDWADTDDKKFIGIWEDLIKRAHKDGFKTYLHFGPLTPLSRETTTPPPSVSGVSLGDSAVRKAYVDQVLEFAEFKPDILGIGIEVNLPLFHGNSAEYNNFVVASKEAYLAVKEKYPSQTVTISFSWDIMRKQGNYQILRDFKDSLDIYSFTTYPNILTAPDAGSLPSDFYSSIRRYLPNERVAISEMAWFSGETGSEARQAAFFQRLPQLINNLNPEFVTLTYLFDIPESFVTDEDFKKFASMGLWTNDGRPKESWNVVSNYGI